jgi:hypothetical protein
MQIKPRFYIILAVILLAIGSFFFRGEIFKSGTSVVEQKPHVTATAENPVKLDSSDIIVDGSSVTNIDVKPQPIVEKQIPRDSGVVTHFPVEKPVHKEQVIKHETVTPVKHDDRPSNDDDEAPSIYHTKF